MAEKRLFEESDLAALAKKYREASGKSRAHAARELGVSRPTLFNAEERPTLSLTKVRIKIIETYSTRKVIGPCFVLT